MYLPTKIHSFPSIPASLFRFSEIKIVIGEKQTPPHQNSWEMKVKEMIFLVSSLKFLSFGTELSYYVQTWVKVYVRKDHTLFKCRIGIIHPFVGYIQDISLYKEKEKRDYLVTILYLIVWSDDHFCINGMNFYNRDGRDTI